MRLSLSLLSSYLLHALAPCEFYPLSLHDALPIFGRAGRPEPRQPGPPGPPVLPGLSSASPAAGAAGLARSEEHTSELQSHSDLVCRLLLEKKKKSGCRRRALTDERRESGRH